MQAGVGGEVVGPFLIGSGSAGGPAHEPGDSGGVGAFESEQVVKRTASGAGFGMMMVVAPQFDLSEEGVDAPVAVTVKDFEGQGFFVVRQQAAVVVKGGDDFASVAQESVAQALLDPFGAFAGA